MSDDLLAAALEYANRGWHVFPVHVGRDGLCSCGKVEGEHGPGYGKHPRTPHGLDDATTDPAIIRSWWKRWPDANIGIACGPSGLDVLDSDPRHGGDESLRDLYQLVGRDAFQTMTCETGGGGLHLYFSRNGHSLGNSAGRLGAGLDTKSVGGYVIAPPSIHPSGNPYVWPLNCGPNECALLHVPEALAAKLVRSKSTSTPTTTGDAIPEGQRNNTLLSLAGTMRRRGMSEAAILAALLEENARRCVPPLADDEVAAIAGSVARYEPSSTSLDGQNFLTDLGNAKRLVSLHGRDLRYVPSWGWLVWDGRHWAHDDTGEIMRQAKDTTLVLYDEAGRMLSEANAAIARAKAQADAGEELSDDTRKALKRAYDRAMGRLIWAEKSQARARLEAMISLAESELDVVARPESFDANPMVLNCLSGTLNLATGELSPHRREDLITKLSPVAFDPDATSEVLDSYLATATDGDGELLAYLQRAAGYTLTGTTVEEALFLLLGPAATGKTTLAEALLSAMGDYGLKLSFDTFLQQRNPGAPRPDLAAMPGARLVVACETSASRHLDEAMVKELTGGDSISTRTLYHPEFTFRPQCKVWLAANEAPTMRDDDSGLWRRVRRLPFEHVIPESDRDPEVKAILTDPGRGGPAVLAWAFRGCIEWQRLGLGTCEAVKSRTRDLRQSFDPLADFLDESCVLTPIAEVTASDLRMAYEQWARANGARPVSGQAWGKRLRNMGLDSYHERRGTVWVGIGLKVAVAEIWDS